MRTCTVMVSCDGRSRIARYVVMQGPMRGRGFDSSRAKTVAIYEISDKPDYAELTARHASKQAPAVRWQRPVNGQCP